MKLFFPWNLHMNLVLSVPLFCLSLITYYLIFLFFFILNLATVIFWLDEIIILYFV